MKVLRSVISIILFLFVVSLSFVNSQERKLSICVTAFDDLVYVGSNYAVPSFISSKINESSNFYTSVFYSQYRKSNLPEAMAFAKQNSIDLILTGTVKQSEVYYDYVTIPSPWGGVRIKNVTVTITFEVMLYSVSNNQLLLVRDFSHSETSTNVGGWTFTDWGRIDVNSQEFRKTPVGVVLNKAAEKLVKALDQEYQQIKNSVNAQEKKVEEKKAGDDKEAKSSSVVTPKILLEGLDKDRYDIVKLYENNFINLTKGTSYFGLKQLSNRNKVFTSEVSPNEIKPFLKDPYAALQVNERPYSLPVFVENVIIPLNPSSDFRILIGNLYWKKNEDIPYFNGLQIQLLFSTVPSRVEGTVYITEDYQMSLPAPDRAKRYDVIAKEKLEVNFFNQKTSVKVLMTNDKLKIFINDNLLLDTFLQYVDQMKQIKTDNIFVCFKGENAFMNYLSIFGIKEKESGVGENIEKIEENLKKLNAKINKDEFSYTVVFNQNDLFIFDEKSKLIKSKSKKFENIMDLINKLVISLKSPDLKVKVQIGNPKNAEKAKYYIKSYLSDISEGAYKVLFLSPDKKDGKVIFRISK